MPPISPHGDIHRLAAGVSELNARWGRQTLSIWRGERPDFAPDGMYAGFEDLLTPEVIAGTTAIEDEMTRVRIRHGLIDHYLQRQLMPHETEMQAWSRGAAAHVDGEKIYFRDIIPWCQKSSTLAKRQKLQQETGPLCKLLKPFAVNYWSLVLDALTEGLGFDSYIDYCQQKKGIDYAVLYDLAKQLIADSDPIYFKAMEAWCHARFEVGLNRLSRFDAIYLLSLGQWDPWCPPDALMASLRFFHHWGVDPSRLSGLYLDLVPSPAKSAQALTVMVAIPDDIHILMRPEGGWIDVETLWHELGHGLSAVFTDPSLPLVARELATTFNLSEAYAFLLQRMALSQPVLEGVLGLSWQTIATIGYYRELRDLAVFRRYAAKFICEFEMFSQGALSDGHPYADTMAQVTGFFHQPESHLFDLVPEFYCADYLLGWMGEAVLEEWMTTRFGENGHPRGDAGQWLQSLWHQGNGRDMAAFFRENGLGTLTKDPLLRRWRGLTAGPPA